MSSVISYFEMKSWGELRPAVVPAGMELRRENDPGVGARMYREVGGKWQWTDRLLWSEEEWQAWMERGEVMTWRVFFEGREAGYLEIEKQEGGSVEIVYFGLRPEMIGKGLGGAMLTKAVEEAWGLGGVKRVWLHTCTEDHPYAVSNYEKRGFRLFRTVRE